MKNIGITWHMLVIFGSFLLWDKNVAGEKQYDISSLCNSPAIVEKKIEKHSLRFKAEENMRRRLFTILLGASAIINVGNVFHALASCFSKTNDDREPSISILSVVFRSLFQLFQSALATYVLHRSLNHVFCYYTYENPIMWLLEFRVELYDHFETLLYMIANQEKKMANKELDEHTKKYIELFVKIISKDTRQICGFMQYRSMLLPTYKQPTVILIQNNILTFLAEWICCVDEILSNKQANLRNLSEKTALFKALLNEQIILFKKIDNDKGMFQEIITAILKQTA